METRTQIVHHKSVRFVQRMLWAALIFALALPFIAKGFSATAWPACLGYIIGSVAALFLIHAFSLFGPRGGMVLILVALAMLLVGMMLPLDFAFLRSSKELRIVLYLASGVCDFGGVLLVGQIHSPLSEFTLEARG